MGIKGGNNGNNYYFGNLTNLKPVIVDISKIKKPKIPD
jgi:hypothetical protein